MQCRINWDAGTLGPWGEGCSSSALLLYTMSLPQRVVCHCQIY